MLIEDRKLVVGFAGFSDGDILSISVGSRRRSTVDGVFHICAEDGEPFLRAIGCCSQDMRAFH